MTLQHVDFSQAPFSLLLNLMQSNQHLLTSYSQCSVFSHAAHLSEAAHATVDYSKSVSTRQALCWLIYGAQQPSTDNG